MAGGRRLDSADVSRLYYYFRRVQFRNPQMGRYLRPRHHLRLRCGWLPPYGGSRLPCRSLIPILTLALARV